MSHLDPEALRPSAVDRWNPWRPLGKYDGRRAAGKTHSEDQAQNSSWKKLFARTHLFFPICASSEHRIFSLHRLKCSYLFPGCPYSFTTKPGALLANPPAPWSWAEIAPMLRDERWSTWGIGVLKSESVHTRKKFLLTSQLAAPRPCSFPGKQSKKKNFVSRSVI